MIKKKQKCKVKTKVVNTYNYCGEDLICTGIEKGDSLAQVIKKLNDSICKETPTYTFEDTTTECETKGFNVYENEELIYTFCQECCGGEGGTTAIIKQLENQLTFDSLTGFPSSNPPSIIANGIHKFTPMDTTIPEVGEYIVTADFTMEYGGATLISGSGIKTLYELRIDGVQIPYSTRFVKVHTGTPTNYINTFTVTTEANITNPNSRIELWFNSNTGDENNSLVVLSCTITAIKK